MGRVSAPSHKVCGVGPAADRRVRRTRGLLHEALFGLIGEKDYDRISVSEILERANIGRSTFYMHFRDKDDLFASAIQEKLESMRAADPASGNPVGPIMGFSRAVFEHIDSNRAAGGARMGRRGRAILHEHLRTVLARWIRDEMARATRVRARTPRGIPTELVAQHVASTLVLVLDWWVDSDCASSPGEADALFRALVLPALSAARPPSAETHSGRAG